MNIKYFIYALVLLLSPTVLAKKTLQFSTHIPENQPLGAISRGLLIEAYKKFNIELTFQVYPVNRSLKYSNSGEVDGEIFRAKFIINEFPNLVLVDEPLLYVDIVAYYLANNKEIKRPIHKWKDLTPYRIAHTKGFRHIKNKMKDTSTIKMDFSLQLIPLLISQKVDVAILSKLDGDYIVNQKNYRDIDIKSAVVATIPAYHLLNSKHQALASKVKMSFKQMKVTGRSEEIISQVMRRFSYKRPSGSTDYENNLVPP